MLRTKGSKPSFLTARLTLAIAAAVILFFGCIDTEKGVSNFVSSASNLSGSTPEVSAPEILSPNMSPSYSAAALNISGRCEDGQKVYIGDSSSTLGTPCSGSSFNLSTSKAVDGSYSYIIYATDPDGRSSASSTLQWIRLSTTPTPPVLTDPTTNPFHSSSTLTLNGICTTGYTVVLSGADSQSEICSNSEFSFVVSQSVDGIYNFNLTQVNQSGISSSATTLQWIRDSVDLSANLISYPPAVNTSTSATFDMSSNKTVTWECSLDGATLTSCTPPVSYPNLSNGRHSFQFKATDTFMNTATSSYTWTQAVYNTVALYHFNNSPGYTVDSSLLTGGLNNGLTNSGTSAGSPGKFNQARRFTASNQNSMSVANNASHALLATSMTLEAWVRLASTPGNSDSYVIASKTGNSSGLYGWEFGIIKNGSNQALYFSGSLDGSAMTTVYSTSKNLGTTSYHYLAVTWNAGVVNFFIDGTNMGSRSIGSGSVALYTPTTALRLGTNTSQYLDALLDEVRISKVVRSITSTPNSAFSPD